MRISDWSSDVCSSDLIDRLGRWADPDDPRCLDRACEGGIFGKKSIARMDRPGAHRPGRGDDRIAVEEGSDGSVAFDHHRLVGQRHGRGPSVDSVRDKERAQPFRLHGSQDARRSEEHTSELQSLMRISYAVFCLKKKKT